jgi:hypothetical protein
MQDKYSIKSPAKLTGLLFKWSAYFIVQMVLLAFRDLSAVQPRPA